MSRKRELSLTGRLVFFIPVVIVYIFSTQPTFTFHPPNSSAIIISMKHATEKTHVCTDEEVKEFLGHEAEKGRKHLRKKAFMCGSRDRVPLKLVVWLDGKELLNKEIQPSGFSRDGNVFTYEKYLVPAGEHIIKIAMRDTKAKEGEEHFDYHFERTLTFEKMRAIVFDFDPETKTIIAT